MCDAKSFGADGRCKGDKAAFRFIRPVNSPTWVYVQLCETHQPKLKETEGE